MHIPRSRRSGGGEYFMHPIRLIMQSAHFAVVLTLYKSKTVFIY